MRRSTPDLPGKRKKHSGRSWRCKHVEAGYPSLLPLPSSSLSFLKNHLIEYIYIRKQNRVLTMEEVEPPSPAAEGKSLLCGRYELRRVLGRGNFAKVYLARDLRSGKSVAMKVVEKEKVIPAGMMEQVKREISAMKMVSHPNIVELHEVMASRSKIFIAMELVCGGDLYFRIARGGPLQEGVARRYFRQLISAVDFCHSRGVYHRDLKPQNLLLDVVGNLKVADFGFSASDDHVRPDGLLHTRCGTPAYVAPEVIGSKGYDGAKADLWSCGVILFVLLAGFLPFEDKSVAAMYKKIQRGDFCCPRWFSSDARRVITKLLDPNPNSRITVAKLVETPWFKKSPIPKTVEGKGKEEEMGEPERLNAFHLISLSEGFDLSPLFEQGGGRREVEMRFATREPANRVISRLEGVAARTAGRYRVTKSGATGVRLEGEELGRKGRLAVVAEIFSVAPSVLMVDVRKAAGDTLDYRSFCSNELRPALMDIIWAASDAQTTAPDQSPKSIR